MKLNLILLKDILAICRLNSNSSVPKWALKGNFYSITHTADELSIVCLQDNIKNNVEKIDKDWRAFKVKGPLDFSLVGIMAHLSGILASGGVSLFVISTYDTDYILVKEKNLKTSIALFLEAGHDVIT